jgi:hypothetical protein
LTSAARSEVDVRTKGEASVHRKRKIVFKL